MTIDEIRDNFALLDDWDDRYRYVIELGRTLNPMPEAEHSAANKVQGCASQVWLAKQLDRKGTGEPWLNYLGDSDAHIVRGLIAILLTLYSGHTPQQILALGEPRLGTAEYGSWSAARHGFWTKPPEGCVPRSAKAA